MQLHIIHLPKRTDRLILLKNELYEQQIKDYKIWNGINNEELTARRISRAHKQIVLYAKQNNLNEILICEDDIHFTAPGAFNYFINNKPSLYDLYLGGITYGKIKNQNLVNDFAGLVLYFVNAGFYDTFLAMPEDKHLDRALIGKGKFIVCNPFAAIQHNGYSDSKKTFCNYDLYFNRYKLLGD